MSMSTPIAFHIMFALAGRRVIFRTPAERALAYRRLLRIGRNFGLLFFHLGSDHIHVVAACSPSELPRFAHAIECSWKFVVGDGPGFAHYHAKPVNDQGHLETLVRYIFQQDEHHSQQLDPFHVGSNAPDLCGGRLGSEPVSDRFRRYLPSIGRPAIERILVGGRVRSVDSFGAAPVGRAERDLERLLRGAAASAVGQADLSGKARPLARARVALLRICDQTPLGRTVVEHRLLDCHPKHVAALRRREASPAVERAVRWQIAFRLQRLERRAQD